jgi:hypothetical protein
MLKTEEFLYFCQLFVEKGCIFASRFNEQNRKFLKFKDFYFNIKNCPDGGIGRRAGLKHLCLHWHAGSTPAPGTKQREKQCESGVTFSVFLFSHA